MKLKPIVQQILDDDDEYVTYKYKNKTYITTIKKNLTWKQFANRKYGPSRYEPGDFLKGLWYDLTVGVSR